MFWKKDIELQNKINVINDLTIHDWAYLMPKNYCNYIHKTGKRKGELCGVISKINNRRCYTHDRNNSDRPKRNRTNINKIINVNSKNTSIIVDNNQQFVVYFNLLVTFLKYYSIFYIRKKYITYEPIKPNVYNLFYNIKYEHIFTYNKEIYNIFLTHFKNFCILNLKRTLKNNKSYYHFIPQNRRLIEIQKLTQKPEDMRIVLYNKFGYNNFIEQLKIRYKKYIKNKKKKDKKKNKILQVIKLNINDKNDLFEKTISSIYSNCNEENKDVGNFYLSPINPIMEKGTINNLKKYSEIILSNIGKLLNVKDPDLNIIYKHIEFIKYKKVIIFNKSIKIENIVRILFKVVNNLFDDENILWFSDNMNILNYKKKYKVDISDNGINIYKKEDSKKDLKLDISNLYILYY